MAGPQQSFTPGSVRASVPKRRFTVVHANKTLPLVKRVVADIVRTHGDVLRLQSDLDTHASRQRALAQAEIESLTARLEDYLDELTEIGCELKDWQMGLIDFVGRHQGRDVCLCWKLGEDRVGYWHELDAGFASRQPISKLRESD